jgi:hypothetical protein
MENGLESWNEAVVAYFNIIFQMWNAGMYVCACIGLIMENGVESWNEAVVAYFNIISRMWNCWHVCVCTWHAFLHTLTLHNMWTADGDLGFNRPFSFAKSLLQKSYTKFILCFHLCLRLYAFIY